MSRFRTLIDFGSHVVHVATEGVTILSFLGNVSLAQIIIINVSLLLLLPSVRGSVTSNNGFCIGWLDSLILLYNYNQLWQFKINDCLRLAPFLTGLPSVFSSTVTDLVLVYESVTSSASVVRWLTLHSWTLNSIRLHEWRMNDSRITKDECRMNDSRITKDECRMNDSRITKDQCRMNDSRITKDQCRMNDSRITKDEFRMKNPSVLLCTAAFIAFGNHGECLLLVRLHGNAFRTKSVSRNPHLHSNLCQFRSKGLVSTLSFRSHGNRVP
jgi:hypothetical protein